MLHVRPEKRLIRDDSEGRKVSVQTEQPKSTAAFCRPQYRRVDNTIVMVYSPASVIYATLHRHLATLQGGERSTTAR
jgi:hypothetical protein